MIFTYSLRQFVCICLVMGVLLWPAIRYHGVVEGITAYIKPVGDRVERTLNIKRKHNSKRKNEVWFAFNYIDSNFQLV